MTRSTIRVVRTKEGLSNDQCLLEMMGRADVQTPILFWARTNIASDPPWQTPRSAPGLFFRFP